MPLLIATNNAHKITEITAILQPQRLQLVTPAQRGVSLEVEENGDTYAANALLKARAGVRLTGLPTLADDSGLEVEALGGKPGLHSSRWHGHLPQAEKNALLVAELAQDPAAPRTARFVCAAALVLPSGEALTFFGECRGRIATAARGAQGFGYDPVFLVDGRDGLTMAELPEGEKNRISHRARALQALRAHPAWAALEAGEP